MKTIKDKLEYNTGTDNYAVYSLENKEKGISVVLRVDLKKFDKDVTALDLEIGERDEILI